MPIAKASIRRSNKSVFPAYKKQRSLWLTMKMQNHRIAINFRRRGNALLLLGIILIFTACGYRVRSSVGKLPNGMQSIGIPTFLNLTNQYKIEQLISSAVLKEFSLRTRTPVKSSSSDVDAVLLGEIRSVSSAAETFGTQTIGSQTYGSAFMITVEASIKLKRTSDSKVIWQNDRFLFRERYVLNANVREFFSEDNSALERLAKRFAESLAGAILDKKNL
jgi:hypothetical protein